MPRRRRHWSALPRSVRESCCSCHRKAENSPCSTSIDHHSAIVEMVRLAPGSRGDAPADLAQAAGPLRPPAVGAPPRHDEADRYPRGAGRVRTSPRSRRRSSTCRISREPASGHDPARADGIGARRLLEDSTRHVTFRVTSGAAWPPSVRRTQTHTTHRRQEWPLTGPTRPGPTPP